MKLGMGVAALVGALAIGGLPAAAGVLTEAPTPATESPARAEKGEVRRGHGPPDHAKAYGLRAKREGEPRADARERPGQGRGHDLGHRHGKRMSALGRRHGEQMRVWSSCVSRHQQDPAACGTKPTPPGHLKHAKHKPRGPQKPRLP
jgi:hypothetical protein